MTLRLTLRRHAGALAFMLLAAAPSFGQTLASAKDFVTTLYAAYDRDPGPDYTAKGAGKNVYSPELLALMRKDEEQAGGEVGALDFDPVCDCQDYTISNVSIDIDRAAHGRALAKVRFKNAAQWQHVTLELLPFDGVWRVADIRGTHVKSLLRYLKTETSKTGHKKTR